MPTLNIFLKIIIAIIKRREIGHMSEVQSCKMEKEKV